jgi:hypothetical protein
MIQPLSSRVEFLLVEVNYEREIVGREKLGRELQSLVFGSKERLIRETKSCGTHA